MQGEAYFTEGHQ